MVLLPNSSGIPLLQYQREEKYKKTTPDFSIVKRLGGSGVIMNNKLESISTIVYFQLLPIPSFGGWLFD